MNSLEQRPSRSAFTLIELIVVIAIIAVLATMVLAGIRTVRSQADRVACSAHLRQLAAASIGYAGENDDIIAPYRHSWDGGATTPLNWKNAFRDFLGESQGTNAFRGDVRTRTVSQGCPTFFKNKQLNNGGAATSSSMLQWGNMGYGYTVRPLSDQPVIIGTATGPLNGNRTPAGYNAAGRLISLSRITHQSSRAMLADAFQDFLPWASNRLESIDQKEIGNRAWSVGTPWRHGSGYNIAYFDGHTAFYSGERFSLPIYAPSQQP